MIPSQLDYIGVSLVHLREREMGTPFLCAYRTNHLYLYLLYEIVSGHISAKLIGQGISRYNIAIPYSSKSLQ